MSMAHTRAEQGIGKRAMGTMLRGQGVQKFKSPALSHARACGILFCYNEEHILKDCIQHYLSQGFDLVVVDNDSTDSSVHIAEAFQKDGGKYPGQIRDVLQIKTEGYEWGRILRFANDYMHERLSHYEWILLIDADAFYVSPVKGMSLLEFMDFVKAKGYNIIDGSLCEFYPTEKDDEAVSSPVERLKYCRIYNPSPQHKIFIYHPSVEFYSRSGHICNRERPWVCLVKFRYLHYPWVSYEHGLKKIFSDRKPRFVERRIYSRMSPQYLGLLPLKKDLVKQSQALKYYREEEFRLPLFLFLCIMRFPYLANSYWLTGWVKRVRQYVSHFRKIFRYGKIIALKDLTERVVFLLQGKLRARSSKGKASFPSEFRTVFPGESVLQRPFAEGLPSTYHFLMTDFCNAGCIFCNQDFDPRSRNQITLDKFKIMLSKIPVTEGNTFSFSGGGDPLLCKDLFAIIDCVRAVFPRVKTRIRTNGLLIGRYADQLAQAGLDRLEISLHGATRESNHAILHAKGQQDVFKGLALLNQRLEFYGNRLCKMLCPVVSRINIDEVPALVERAAALKVDEVSVVFTRYYPRESYQVNGQPSAKEEDSLFYHKEKYNEVILQSRRLARSLGVLFKHEPLFFESFREKRCFQPWCTMVVNWDGEVYPCTGGEVWFRRKVKSGAYHFGNLLEEHLADFWNNDSYTRIRRTLGSQHKEAFIPECHNCHNTSCFKGSDVKSGHILEPHDAAGVT